MSEEEGRIHKNGGYDDRTEALGTFRSAASVSMSPELFEKLYLSPLDNVKGDLRKPFANSIPMCVYLSAPHESVSLMLMPTLQRLGRFPACLDPVVDRPHGMGRRRRQWLPRRLRRRDGVPSLTTRPSSGVFYFQGGVLLALGGILEWILGKTFPAVVFTVFGTFWLAYAGTLDPSFAAFASYAPPDSTSPAAGLTTQGFNATLVTHGSCSLSSLPVEQLDARLTRSANAAFWFLFMAFICVIFLICSLRTNVCFFIMFLTLVIALSLITGAFLANAADYTGNAAYSKKLLVGAGATIFVTCWVGWYLFFAILLATVDFPIQLPIGDLSTIVKGKSEKDKRA
ncbi:Protein alcS [Tolypocladium ophioglossoides CBS 100239]|uniref:Protein alcS n=1 Tax=Tolypocladium ophioglossoides (strain CBS 100239) TaxID=1163406 RepID=A0A0L0NJG3_TOLOC|nr:Protein alcS [Tolypocladium ophioglossoides CBS 100239]